MKNIILSSFIFSVFAAASSQAQIASDNGGNYGGGWTNGANGGSGFLGWNISVTPGTGFAGAFIGEPTNAGIVGMSSTSFGLFANPGGSGASATVSRAMSNALSVGDTFSFQWGINWDSDGGSKGFRLFSGGIGGTELLNVNQGSFPGAINFIAGGATNDTGISFGTTPMTWSFTLSSASSLSVTASSRTNISTTAFSTNLSVIGAPNAFSFYANAMGAGDARQPYFNNLSVVPEPSTYALLALSAVGLAGYAARRRARK